MLARLVRPALRVSTNGVRQYHDGDKPFKYASMDDAPVPSGSWQEYYDKRQKTFNLQLIGGILFLTATLAFGKANGLLYLNWGPPEIKDQEAFDKIDIRVRLDDD